MMPPNLSNEDKKQIREAQRNNAYISLTWQLFNNYLARYEDNPSKALELALAAMEVWRGFEDSQVMEYPEVKPVDFGEQMKEAMSALGDKFIAARTTVRGAIMAMDGMEQAKEACCATGEMTGGKQHDAWCQGT